MTQVKAYAAESACAPLGPFSLDRRIPLPDDVVINIKYCGVCHTDIHMTQSSFDPAIFPSIFPMVPGHEIVGIVTSIGSDVTKFKVGDRVGVGTFVDSGASIGACDRASENYHAEHLVITYGGYEHDHKTLTYGGYSQAITVKEDYVLHIPEALSLDAAAPLLCAGITLYSPLRHWKAGKGKKVAIIGLGGLGHLGVKLAHAMGADVTVLSQSLSKEVDGRRFGADHYFATSDPETFKKLERSFDLILNTVDAPIDWNLYIAMLNIDGCMVQLGVPLEGVPVKALPLMLGRRSLAGSAIGNIRETQEMLDFCGEHGIVADIEIIPIQKINESFERMLKSDVRFRFVIDMASLDN